MMLTIYRLVCSVLLIALSLMWGKALRLENQNATLRGDISIIKQAHSEQAEQTASAALKRIVTANQRADSLQAELESAEQRLITSKTETQREIIKNTTGRACLNNATVRLLNANNINDTARSKATALPTPASFPAAPDAAIATDLDVATWANTAITQYDSCRARLAALIAWHLPITSPEENPHD